MAHLSQVDVDTLVGAFENKVYGVGDILMTQGEEGDCFYVIEVRPTRLHATASTQPHPDIPTLQLIIDVPT